MKLIKWERKVRKDVDTGDGRTQQRHTNCQMAGILMQLDSSAPMLNLSSIHTDGKTRAAGFVRTLAK